MEVFIALLLTSTAIMALLSLQPSAWRLSGKSDYLGRAAGILRKELETQETLLMNPSYVSPYAPNKPFVGQRYVFGSAPDVPQPGGGPQPGDVAFGVQTIITDLTTDPLKRCWSIRVVVTWPGNNTGISETIFVMQQKSWEPLWLPTT